MDSHPLQIKQEIDKHIRSLKNDLGADDLKHCAQAMHKIFDKLINPGSSSRDMFRRLKTTNQRLQTRVFAHQSAIGLLEYAGFEFNETGNCYILGMQDNPFKNYLILQSLASLIQEIGELPSPTDDAAGTEDGDEMSSVVARSDDENEEEKRNANTNSEAIEQKNDFDNGDFRELNAPELHEEPDVPSTHWACSVCTYHNIMAVNTCTLCNVGSKPVSLPGGGTGMLGDPTMRSLIMQAAHSGDAEHAAQMLQSMVRTPEDHERLLQELQRLAGERGTGKGILAIQNDYNGDPGRVLVQWTVAKALWTEYFNQGYNSTMLSERFVITYNGDAFTFQLDLGPAGQTERQRQSSQYGFYVRLIERPPSMEAISLFFTSKLAELPTHKFDTTCQMKKPVGVGPNMGYARWSEVNALEVDELNYVVDLRILSVLSKDAQIESRLVVHDDYQGESSRLMAEWHVPVSTWKNWESHYGFSESVDSVEHFFVQHQGVDMEFYFHLAPKGRTPEHQRGGHYGMGIFLAKWPRAARKIHLDVTTGLQGFPTHTRQFTTTLERAQGTGRPCGGPRRDIDRIDGRFVVFTADVKITDVDWRFEPMPTESEDLLKSWRLHKYASALEAAGMIEREYWLQADDDFLKSIGMNAGEVIRFKNNCQRELTKDKDLLEALKMSREEQNNRPSPEPTVTAVENGRPTPPILFSSPIPSVEEGTVAELSIEPVEEEKKMPAPLPDFDESKDLETSWVAMFRRRKPSRLKAKLDDAERPYRERTDLTEYRDSDFQSFLEQTTDLRHTLEKLGDLYQTEVDTCRKNPGYFKDLVIFTKYTKKNMLHVNSNEQYALAHHNLLINFEDDWNKGMDLIEEIAAEVQERNKYRVFRQPMTDLLAMYPYVIVTQNRLRNVLEELGEQLKLQEEQLYVSGFKSLYRIWEKMALHRYRRWDPDVWDMSRGLISFEKMTQIGEALDVLDRHAVIEIINVDCRFAREKKAGWQDVMVHVVFRDQPSPVQIISEIQLCIKDLTVLRKQLGGHDAYAAFRSAGEIRRFVDPDQEMEREIVW